MNRDREIFKTTVSPHSQIFFGNAIVEKFYFNFLWEKVLFEMKFLYQLCSSRKLSAEFGNKNVSQSKIGLFSKLVFEEKLEF